MVMRYFQSKAGLFTAAISTDLEVPDLSSVPASRAGELLARYFVSQIGGTLGVAALGTIVAAGHHAPAGAAAFQAGLGHAFLAVAALPGLCAVAVAVLGRGGNRRHGRYEAP